jgi:hypothetical protein
VHYSNYRVAAAIFANGTYFVDTPQSYLVPEEFKFHYRWLLIQNLLHNIAAKNDTFPNVEISSYAYSKQRGKNVES